MIANTSSERVDTLIARSDQLYPSLEHVYEGETRARRIVRLGIRTVAECLEDNPLEVAGNAFDALVQSEIRHSSTASTRSVTYLDELAATYAGVRRATITRAGRPETDALHVARLAALAPTYAKEQYPHLDPALVSLYCLVHDLLEAYTGDVPTLGVSDAVLQRKYDAEQRALEQLENELGDDWPGLVSLVVDYENLADEEAAFVKTFDKLDPSFSHLYNDGILLTTRYGYTTLAEFTTATQHTTRRIMKYAGPFPELQADRLEFIRRIGERTVWPKAS